MAEQPAVVWQAIGATVRGASHQRDGRPNQDALGLPPIRTGPPLVLAIADGHGSARYTRSDRGSRFAIEVALEILAHGFGEPVGAEGLSRIKREATELLPRRLLTAWQQRVDADLARNPLTPDELAAVTAPRPARSAAVTDPAPPDGDEPGPADPPSPDGEPGDAGVTPPTDAAGGTPPTDAAGGTPPTDAAGETPPTDAAGPAGPTPLEARIPYGSTLLAVVVTAGYLLYLQLGDGDILVVDALGTVHQPLPDDARLLANETTSLCSDEAWKDFRVGFQVLDAETPGGAPDSGPVLVMLSTDGLANSYRTAADFEQFAGDVLGIIRDKGLARTELDLPAWLTDATTTGSGDDITVALARREEPFDLDATTRQREQLQQTVRALSQQTTALDANVTAMRTERDDLRETVSQQAARLREQDERMRRLDRWFGTARWHRPVILLLALVTLTLAVRDVGRFFQERQPRRSPPAVRDAAAATADPDRIDHPVPAPPPSGLEATPAAGTSGRHAEPTPVPSAPDATATPPETRDKDTATGPRPASSSAPATRGELVPAGPGSRRATPDQASPTADARTTRKTKGQTDGGTTP